jgi:hypothetical protein
MRKPMALAYVTCLLQNQEHLFVKQNVWKGLHE